MDGRIDRAQLDDFRTYLRNETAVGSASRGGKCRRAAGVLQHRALDGLHQLATARDEGQPRQAPLKFVLELVPAQDLLQARPARPVQLATAGDLVRVPEARERGGLRGRGDRST